MHLSYILVVLSSFTPGACQLSSSEFGYSEGLLTLFESTLSECSIRIFLNKWSIEAGNELTKIVSYYDEVLKFKFPSFYINYFRQNRQYNFLEYKGSYGKVVILEKNVLPLWSFQKYSLCSSQIYFVDSEQDTKTIVLNYFVEMEVLKISPQYLIFWDARKTFGTPWTKYFRVAEFYGSFIDSGLLISINTDTNLLGVDLICILCGSSEYKNADLSLVVPIPKPTSTNIHAIWKAKHGNYYTVPIQVVCQMFVGGEMSECVRQDLFSTIGQQLNANVVLAYEEKYNGYGFISDKYPLYSVNIAKFFVRSRWPNLYLTGSSASESEHWMITVVPKSLLVQSGLSSLRSCFSPDCLVTLLIFVAWLILFLPQFDENLRKQLDLLCLYVFSPMTDHWMTIRSNILTCRILFLWSILCYSMTCLYGGEFASSMSVMEAPVYPRSLSQLGTNIVNLDATFYNNKRISYLAFELEKRIEIGSDSDNSFVPGYIQDILTLNPNLVEKLYSCVCLKYSLSVLNRTHPIVCKPEANFSFNEPLTMLGSTRQIDGAQMALESSRKYWVSLRAKLTMFAETSPVILGKNFFAKLAEPIINAWWTYGLSNKYSRLWSTYKVDGGKTLHFEEAEVRASVLTETEALSMQQLGGVWNLILCLNGVASLAFGVERFYYMNVSFPTFSILSHFFCIAHLNRVLPIRNSNSV